METNRHSGRATPEPNPQATAGWRIALILLGILVTPVVLSSPALGVGLDFVPAVGAIAVGSVILTVLAAITLCIGQKAGQTTYDIVRFPFGRSGAGAINALLAVSLLGWTAVTANGFGLALQSFISTLTGVSVPLPVLVIIGCVIFVASTVFGLERIGQVAQIAVPVIAVILVLLAMAAVRAADGFAIGAGNLGWGVAVSTVVGTGIVLVVTAADFGSFAQSPRDALVAACLTFLGVYPLIYIVGAIPSAVTGEASLLAAMSDVGFALGAVVLLIIAAVSANSGNVFQSSLVIGRLIGRTERRVAITVSVGVFAAILGSFDIGSWLPSFLLLLGIAAPPVAGIYATDCFLNRTHGYDEALVKSGRAIRVESFVIWAVASGVGYLAAFQGLVLTRIPSIDSILTAAVLYAAVVMTTRYRTGARTR